MILAEWVLKARTLGASDVHLQAGTPVVVRVRGELSAVSEALPAARVAEMGRELLNNEQWEHFRARGSADLSINVAGTRCRVNLFQTVRGAALAVRLLAASTNTLKSCNLHPDLGKLTAAQTGLVIVSGPTGCGKSTTLAAMIEEINASRARNIITIESPIEYLYTNHRSFIRQREVPTHSPSYEQAIIDALRENPDVLVIGEMRTPEAMRLTLNAAETGHLVLATMHSSTCAEALNRLCMSFASEIQGSVRAQVADCLVAVVCQRLEYLQDYQLRAPLCEVLMANSNAKGTIRSGSFSQLATVIQSGGEDGMWSFDRYRRWMEQKRDWVMPSQQSASPPLEMQSHAPPPPAPVSRPTPKPATEAPIDISIDESADLTELARKIEKKIR
ncbi:type IV pilus twitching motility protein PilT [Steroidobacter agaridevorans]|uniref:type IV pilus twitching motility protein PilT n=1 Tax=Steroidobacter agaridevorans TaxID=2695856 RepID=UPI0013234951|nr:ATPase, T2SS/T4P/T4SS family [Steroidobacter agaridevorans]GFE85794.1 twitching motility protein PilT [Steroidobacter agaridevorans]